MLSLVALSFIIINHVYTMVCVCVLCIFYRQMVFHMCYSHLFFQTLSLFDGKMFGVSLLWMSVMYGCASMVKLWLTVLLELVNLPWRLHFLKKNLRKNVLKIKYMRIRVC